ncbi:MAG: Crp/Fnr family transcriptional regulator [Trebonia sp.]
MFAADPRDFAQRYRAGWPSTSFLAGLENSALHDFLTSGELTRFRRGQALINEGEESNDVFLLLNASVKVTARLDDGGKALLAIRVGGDAVGEIAALDPGTRTATVVVAGHEPLDAVRLSHDDLHELLDDWPAAAVSLTATVSRKLRAATRRQVDMLSCTAKVGMARVVLELAEDYGYPAERGGTLVAVNVTQIELGSLVGVGETTAQRALRALRREGLIANAGRRLLVPNMAALRSATQAE